MNHPNGNLAGQFVQKNQPPLNEPVWVKCEGYRCLAVLDFEGKWRTYINGAPLQGVIEVLLVTDPRPTDLPDQAS